MRITDLGFWRRGVHGNRRRWNPSTGRGGSEVNTGRASVHDGREIRGTPTTGTGTELRTNLAADGGTMADESGERDIGNVIEQRVVVRGDGRTTEIHVQGPAIMVIHHADEGGNTSSTRLNIRRSSRLAIVTLPMVDEERNRK